MALAGVGVDMLEIARMQRAMERTPRFVERVFSEEERQYCSQTARPAEHFAARFAAREAILKSLGTGFGGGIHLSDVWVSRSETGRPLAMLSGKAAEIAAEQGIREIALSLSHTHDVAVANAIAVSDAVRPVQEDKGAQERELLSSFKQARSVIDELERIQDAIMENAGLSQLEFDESSLSEESSLSDTTEE